MIFEWRMKRAEWILKVLAIRGRKHRNEFREKIDILVNCQIDTNEQLNRTEKLIQAFAAKTDEALDRLTASQVKTDETLDRLTASQIKTDEALRRFINSLRKSQNGHSEN